MSWFNTEGNCPHYYIWSKTRYVRNAAKLPFRAADPTALAEVFSTIEGLLTQNGFRKELLSPSRLSEILALAEKQLADADLCDGEGEKALYLNEPCNLTVSVGGKNLISIQSILSGRAVTETQNIAAGAEELIDGEIELAYSEKYGYLSPNPTECGSGTEYSAALFLPALKASGQIESRRLLCQRMGVNLTPLSLHPQNPGDIYVALTRASHRLGEESERRRFEAVCDKLEQNEKAAERMIFKDKSKLIIDKAWRAYGLLRYAKQMDEAELLRRLSELRLGLATTESKEALPPVTPVLLNSLLAEGLNASVVTSSLPPLQNSEECAEARARLLSSRLSAEDASGK